MKILHLLGAASQQASGPTYSVQCLAREQGLQGEEVLLYSQTGEPFAPSKNFLHRTFPVSRGMTRYLHSAEMSKAMRELSLDVVHNHGMWMAQGLYARSMLERGRTRLLVTSPRGSLAAYAMRHNRWRKRLMWPLQHRVLACSQLLHATAEHEVEDIRRHGFRQPVALVANGIDLPEQIPPPDGSLFGPKRTLLFLGRIHRLKGLDELLDAWDAVAARHPTWQLAIAGPELPAAGYDLKAQIARRGLERVLAVGPLYGEDKTRAYREAELYVLPSYGENFGVTIAEALAQGTPAVTSHGTPWRVLEEHEAGWWIPHDTASLTACLDAALAKSKAELSELGARGRRLVADEFAWPALAEKLLAAYAYALGRGPRPDWVHLA